MATQTPARLNCIAPFFIVSDLQKSLDFYHSKLGFDITYTGGGNGEGPDYFGIVQRDGVMLMLKQIGPETQPQPNRSRHDWARWDAYVSTSDPDLLFVEYVEKSVPIHRELADTDDGLRTFEVRDSSGYVLCFGCPQEK